MNNKQCCYCIPDIFRCSKCQELINNIDWSKDLPKINELVEHICCDLHGLDKNLRIEFTTQQIQSLYDEIEKLKTENKNCQYVMDQNNRVIKALKNRSGWIK